MVEVVQQFYDSNPQMEWERLERHPVEFAVTLRALKDYFPMPPARILDVGGGPGRYSIELTLQGYAVTLIDLSSGNLDLAQAKAAEVGVQIAHIQQGNALDLSSLPDIHYDAALLLGPLYHLLEKEQRIQAVQQTLARLKPGGLIAAAFIVRYAALRDLSIKDPAWILAEGNRHLLNTGELIGRSFPHAYLAHPAEVIPFMESTGCQTLELIAAEGVMNKIDNHIVAEAKGDLWDAWIDLHYRLGKDPSLHGAADHLLYVGRKPA
jgi:S-adenosylmethionine-dependent methyltransferase